MITLRSFGPAFGLPDPSPFVTKAEVLLKMAGLPYTVDTGGFKKAPKGKLPYIDDDGETIADSTFIRWRWMDDANFAKGPRNFFRTIPAPIRPVVVAMIRRQLRRTLHGQGIGRHSPEEIVALGTRSIDATADFLGTQPFMMGPEPTGLDAAAFAFVAGVLCPLFETPLRTAAERHHNLRRYVGRMTARFYPEQSEMAGCKAAA